MSKNAKRTETIQIMLASEELQAIDDWRFGNRVPSRAAAIRELIRRGLIKSKEFETPPADARSGDFRVTPGSGDQHRCICPELKIFRDD